MGEAARRWRHPVDEEEHGMWEGRESGRRRNRRRRWRQNEPWCSVGGRDR